MSKEKDFLYAQDEKVDISKEVNFIWAIANRLRGPYQSDKYKDVIIPMVIIRRFESALEPTKAKVLDVLEKHPDYPDKALKKIAGYPFYNKSRFSLAELVNDPDHLAENFKDYLNGFNPRVQQIIKNLEFEKQIDKMNQHNRLLSVVKAFSELELDPNRVDNIKMGYIFEDLIRRFSENAEAGDHYTGRDLIAVATACVLAEGCEDLFDDYKIVSVLDQAAGTGGMLSTAYNFIKRMNPTADIHLYGQEINPESEAICEAEFMIKGQDSSNIRLADTMKTDCFQNTQVRLCLENPPFGQAWKGKEAGDGVEKAVMDEYAKGDLGRFPAGLPSDMQLLFFQSAIDKLETNGRAAIFSNGSPLFTGGVSSGDSQIRKWLLENDYIDAIIQLGTDLFYNTGITTYIWILSKQKQTHRRGKIQLIDASSFSHKLRKALGNKRNEITPEDRKQIVELYANFEENEYSKIFDNDEFIYREYTVMQPLQRSYAMTPERIENLISGNYLSSLYDEAKVYQLENSEDELSAKDQKALDKYQENKPKFDTIIDSLKASISDKTYTSPKAFEPALTQALVGIALDKKLKEKIMDGLSKMDKNAEIQRDKKGNILYDKETKDTETIKINESVEDYMKKEVLPYVPDAKWFFEEDLSKKKPIIKTGAEIPFTRFFYKYQQTEPLEKIVGDFMKLDQEAEKLTKVLFGDAVND